MQHARFIERHGTVAEEEGVVEAERLDGAGRQEAAAYLKEKEDIAKNELELAKTQALETAIARAQRDVLAWQLVCRTREGTTIDELLTEMGDEMGVQERSRILNAYHKKARQVSAFCVHLLSHTQVQSNTRQQALLRSCRRRRRHNRKATNSSSDKFAVELSVALSGEPATKLATEIEGKTEPELCPTRQSLREKNTFLEIEETRSIYDGRGAKSEPGPAIVNQVGLETNAVHVEPNLESLNFSRSDRGNVERALDAAMRWRQANPNNIYPEDCCKEEFSIADLRGWISQASEDECRRMRAFVVGSVLGLDHLFKLVRTTYDTVLSIALYGGIEDCIVKDRLSAEKMPTILHDVLELETTPNFNLDDTAMLNSRYVSLLGHMLTSASGSRVAHDDYERGVGEVLEAARWARCKKAARLSAESFHWLDRIFRDDGGFGKWETAVRELAQSAISEGDDAQSAATAARTLLEIGRS